MTVEQQRRTFESTQTHKAIRVLDQNDGKPLSPAQLQPHLDEAIEQGMAARAIALAALRPSAVLTRPELEKLIDRCIHYESFPDAILVFQQGQVSDSVRERLLEVCVRNGLAADRQEAEDLLVSD